MGLGMEGARKWRGRENGGARSCVCTCDHRKGVLFRGRKSNEEKRTKGRGGGDAHEFEIR